VISAENKMIEGENFLVIGEDWGYYPSTTEHLLRRFVARNRFLWIDAIGCRAPQLNLYTLRRVWGKLIHSASANGRPARENGVTVYSPPVLPLYPVSAVRRWNRLAMSRGIARRLKDLRMENPILLATNPMAAEVLAGIPAKLVIYYILDNYEEMPHHYRAYTQELEARMIERADLIFATAQPLVEKKSKPGRPVILLPQGVDFDHFHGPVAGGAPEPEDLASIPKPRILFMGLLAPWVDVDLLRKVAQAYPHASLVFLGPVRTDIEALRREPNTYFLGQRPYSEIPRYLAHCDAALIPFRQNALTRYVNPLKLLEYMAAGLPVISTALPHLAAFDGLVYSACNAEDFVEQVGRALSDFPSERRARSIAAARENSWEQRAEQFSTYVHTTLCAVGAEHEAVPIRACASAGDAA
jgi:glycosyltransferase involved in cell wall biosynthesis